MRRGPYSYGLKSATDDLGWVRHLSSLGFACLRPVWPRVSRADCDRAAARLGLGFGRTRLFREFSDFASARTTRGGTISLVSPVRTEFKARVVVP